MTLGQLLDSILEQELSFDWHPGSDIEIKIISKTTIQVRPICTHAEKHIGIGELLTFSTEDFQTEE